MKSAQFHIVKTLAVTVTLALLILPMQDLSAATFYVDPVNGSMSNDGSSAAPWRTLQEVFADGLIQTKTVGGTIKNLGAPVQSGDTILLRTGYHGDVNYTGAYNDDYITIAADVDHTPQLRRFRLNAAEKWIIRGLTLSPSLAASFSRDTIVDFYSRTSNGTCRYITIEDCFIYTILDNSSWSASDWDTKACNGINLGMQGRDLIARNNYLLNVNFGVTVEAEDSLADGNTIENFSGDGIRTTYHGVTAQYNIIKNCYDVNANHDDGIQGYLANIGAGEVLRVSLIGNIVINREDDDQPLSGALQGLGNFGGPYNYWTVLNNVVMTDHWHGITIYNTRYTTVANNTVFNKFYHDGLTNHQSWIDIRGHTNIVRNNIAQYYTIEGTMENDHNLRITRSDDPDQWFTDYRNYDLTLVEGSPAINAGIGDDAPDVDQTGKRRPILGQWDAGAFEFGEEDAYVTAAHIIYNNSAFDNGNPAANADDDNAIATDKQPLLPGESATFTHYTSYSKGINGIMLDIIDLEATPVASDFEFKVGNNDNPETWDAGPTPVEIAVRSGAGVDGSHRVTLIFADYANMKKWLKVTVLPTDNTGLSVAQSFYFGNATGDTGDQADNAIVDATDEINCRNNPRHFLKPAMIDDVHDHDRDGKVNATDEVISRNNTTTMVSALRLITPPAE